MRKMSGNNRNKRDVAREILRILMERMDASPDEDQWADIARIELVLKERGVSVSAKTIHRLLTELEAAPNRVDKLAREIAKTDQPTDELEFYRLVTSRKGRRRLYRLGVYRIRPDDLRYREELRDLQRWRERLEREFGPLGRATVEPYLEPNIRKVLISAAESQAQRLREMSWADAAEATAQLLRRIGRSSRKGLAERIAKIYDLALRTFRPDLFEWKTDPDPHHAPDNFALLSERLEEETSSRLLEPLPTRSAASERRTSRCSTDATRLRVEWLPLELYLGAARLEQEAPNQISYAYSTEPPLAEPLSSVPRDIEYVRWLDDEEDGYVRRARRAHLDRIHYQIENDVLSGAARWLGAPPSSRLIHGIIHDGRILPELLRLYDLLVVTSEGQSVSVREYVDLNRRVLQTFMQTYTSALAEGRIIGMVKMERLALPILLIVGALMNFEGDPDVIGSVLEWILSGIISDIRFSLHVITGIIGSSIYKAVEGPFIIEAFPRPVSAFQDLPPDRLRQKISEVRQRAGELRQAMPREAEALETEAEFLESLYLPLIEKGQVFYFYCVPMNLGDERLCFPRFEVFVAEPKTTDSVLARARSTLFSLIESGGEWERDMRHDENSRYGLLVPRVARDVDKGALIAGEELRRRILERIEEIRREARRRGFPF